ncbi:MAG: hypothetical protein AB7R00_28450 [Kofleriaceae bacterium]
MLRELGERHETFLRSDEGEPWLSREAKSATPPLVQFARRHHFRWPRDIWCSFHDVTMSPAQTVGEVGRAVVYPQQPHLKLGLGDLCNLFSKLGANRIGWDERVRVTATGRNSSAIDELRDYLAQLTPDADPRTYVPEPPWGEQAEDPRLAGDEDDCNARLLTDHDADTLDQWGEAGPNTMNHAGGELELVLMFENTFGGAVAIENWLRSSGFRSIKLEIEAGWDPLRASKPRRKSRRSQPSAAARPLRRPKTKSRATKKRNRRAGRD